MIQELTLSRTAKRVVQMSSAREQAALILEAWSAGEPADTQAALSRFPHLRLDKSVVLDLAYEEYCLRLKQGEVVEPESFCARFPDYRTSLRHLIDVHQFLDERPSTLPTTPAFQWPKDGAQFEEYRIVRQLGRGAFARVYLAWHEATNSRVVVKVSIGDAKEARLAGPLAHDAVVPVKHACSLPSGVSYVVMPFLGCATLHDVLDVAFPTARASPKRADLILRAQELATRPDDGAPVERNIHPRLKNVTWLEGVTFLLTELARGLAFLHSRGIRHRDLKPSNVLLRWDGRPVILDFNLAEDAQADLPRCGGTMPYMAPEQIQAGLYGGQTSTYDQRADLFSFGVIAYELLTGLHPFGMPAAPARTSQEPLQAREIAVWLLGRQRSGFRPLRREVPEIDPALARTVERCLSFDPSKRPSAPDVVANLERLARWPHRLGQRIRRHPRVAAVVGVVLATFVLWGAALAATRPPYEQRQYDRAVAAYREHKTEAGEDILDELLKHDRSNAKYLYLRGLTRVRRHAFPDACSDFSRAFKLAPDGRTAAYTAYCLAMNGDHTVSVFYASKAEAMGVQTAALYNNRGFSYYRGNPEQGLDEKLASSQQDIDEAIRRDGELAEAYFNRARLGLRLWEMKRDLGAIDRAAVDVDRALQKSFENSTPYSTAAVIHANCKGMDAARTKKILHYLHLSFERGGRPKIILPSLPFAEYMKQPEFQRLLEIEPLVAPVSVYIEPGLVEPLADPLQ